MNLQAKKARRIMEGQKTTLVVSTTIGLLQIYMCLKDMSVSKWCGISMVISNLMSNSRRPSLLQSPPPDSGFRGDFLDDQVQWQSNVIFCIWSMFSLIGIFWLFCALFSCGSNIFWVWKFSMIKESSGTKFRHQTERGGACKHVMHWACARYAVSCLQACEEGYAH